MKNLILALVTGLLLNPIVPSYSAEFHVAVSGSDSNKGTRKAPWRTIQRAAERAQPGDVITVHEGTYRERINPPRGGTSESRRITYQAARGERVEIKGSEVVKGWTRVQEGVWKIVLPNSFFGSFNPYTNLIHGDWFDRRNRDHHTGAVYVNGAWLTEAAKIEEVLLPAGQKPDWMKGRAEGFLLNVAWLQPGNGAGERIPAIRHAAKLGTQDAECSEGGGCVGFISEGHWLGYDNVEFGSGTDKLDLRVASATDGGIIEVRLGGPDGTLLGSCTVPHTGGWQTWRTLSARLKPVNGRQTICLVFKSLQQRKPGVSFLDPRLWFAQVDATNTIIWAQFENANPNEELVEINARQTVFYPDQPGRNYITVRGFALRHAATPWAPPTAEQIGLIGTHWSKGWIIENNTISHSVCSGIALGKHGDQFDNTSANTAEGYVKTIERAHAFRIPWTRENIGHHVVRNNTVSHCEQAGIVGSLGAAFCTVTGNTIHDVHVRRLFSGAEMAGIKFHGAIDTVLEGNHIYRCCQALWLDWMAQGTRVSRNLFHDNLDRDLFVEVNHGPFIVDNNLFLSGNSLLDMSQSGAYLHNLFAGKLTSRPELNRETPYHPPHSTTVAGLKNIDGSDNRFFNNLFIGQAGPAPAKADPQWGGNYGTWMYDFRKYPVIARGNVYYQNARPSTNDAQPTLVADLQTGLELVEEGKGLVLRMNPGTAWREARTALVTTEALGKARVPQLPYILPDGAPLKLNMDYFGKRRSAKQPVPGPFERLGNGMTSIRLN